MHLYENNFKVDLNVKDLNVKVKTIKLLEHSIVGYIPDFIIPKIS